MERQIEMKDVLLIKLNAFLKKDTINKLHDEFVEQIKSGVVIIPALVEAEVLSIPKDVEIVIQPKGKETTFMVKKG